MIRNLIVFMLFVLLPQQALAHKPSDSYLVLQVDGENITGQWDIALRDLEHAIGLDADGDGAITWGELKARHAAIAAYAFARLTLRSDNRDCDIKVTDHLVDTHSDGAYAVLRFDTRCNASASGAIEVDYRLFFDLDPTHRGLLRWESDKLTTTGVLSPERPTMRMQGQQTTRLAQFIAYAREGVWHIWIGIDHILFLISLLLPAVLFATARVWTPVERFAPAFWDVFKVVTSFTVAHSITLSLAALSIISLPTRLTETAIAVSVLLAALNNIWPVVHGKRWMVAFGFGLIHGFGFASVLAGLGLPQDALLTALVGFNLGVEAGQLVIVGAFLPAAYFMRRSVFYRRVILIGGSAVIALLAALWTLERGFDLQLFSE
ncbi:MAG: HupE/UreJ family protein [Pseudomonadota bacterium]